MKRVISFKKIIKVLKNKNWQDEIQLEVEGKFLKTKHYLLVKKWLVPKKLLKQLGMEGTVIDRPNKEKPPRVTLKDLMESMNNGFASVNQRLDKVETRLDVIEDDVKILKSDVKILKSDVKLIKSLPTIQQETKELKK